MADTGLDAPNNRAHGSFVLPEKFTIALATETFQRLMSQVEQGGDIALEGGGVQRIDAAGVQLLLVVQQALREARNTLRWVTVSDALRESVNLLGLAEQLALPAEQ